LNKKQSLRQQSVSQFKHHKVLTGIIAIAMLFIGGIFTSRLPSSVLEYMTPSLALVNVILLLIVISILVDIKNR